MNTADMLTGARNPIEITIVILYFVFCVLVGFWANKRTTKTTDSYFTGDRSFGLFISVFAAFAAYASGGTFVGLIGSAYKLGLAFVLCSGLSVLFGWMCSAILVAPFLREMNIKTVSDFFKERYNKKSINILTSVIVFIAFTIYITAQFKAAGLSVQYLFKIDYIPAISIIVPIVIFYVATGGMWAVTVTDVLQGILMAFMMFILPIVILTTDGVGIFDLYKNAVKVDPGFGSMNLGPFSYIGMMTTWGFAQFCLPHVVMRITSAKDSKTAQIMLPINGLLYLFSHILYIGVLGAAIAILYPILTNPIADADYAYFVLVEHYLPNVVFRGFAVSVVLAAMMSSVDAFLLAVAAAFSNDFLPNVLPNIKEATQVKIGAWTVVGVGIIAYLFALNPPALLLILYTEAVSFLLAGLAAPLVLGIWWKRANATGALWSIIFGSGVYGFLVFMTTITNIWTLPTASAILIGLPCGFIGMIVGSLVGEPDEERSNYMAEIHRKRFGELMYKQKTSNIA